MNNILNTFIDFFTKHFDIIGALMLMIGYWHLNKGNRFGLIFNISGSIILAIWGLFNSGWGVVIVNSVIVTGLIIMYRQHKI